MGLVNEVVPAGQAVPRAVEVAQELRARPFALSSLKTAFSGRHSGVVGRLAWPTTSCSPPTAVVRRARRCPPRSRSVASPTVRSSTDERSRPRADRVPGRAGHSWSSPMTTRRARRGLLDEDPLEGRLREAGALDLAIETLDMDDALRWLVEVVAARRTTTRRSPSRSRRATSPSGRCARPGARALGPPSPRHSVSRRRAGGDGHRRPSVRPERVLVISTEGEESAWRTLGPARRAESPPPHRPRRCVACASST